MVFMPDLSANVKDVRYTAKSFFGYFNSCHAIVLYI